LYRQLALLAADLQKDFGKSIANSMKTFIAVILLCILFVICWPLAIAMFFLFPIVWLLLVPFRILGFTLDAVFKLIREMLLLPFRIVKAI